jgi:hypothetical protein
MIRLVFLTFLLLVFFPGCNKDEDFVKTLPSCPDGVVFPVSPIALEDVIRIVPLGHYRPSPHVFPTSHHYIDIIRGKGNIPIYAPCDGWINFVTENQLPAPYHVEYSVTLWACRDMMVMYGHVPRLDQAILDQLGKVTKTNVYSTGGVTFNLNIYEPRIRVKAGDRIGELPDMPGIPSLAYEFYPEASGTHNRPFNLITNDGKIYTFSNFVNIWDEPYTDFLFPSQNVIFMQLVDEETLRIEQQTTSDGPPWSFKNNFRDFKR